MQRLVERARCRLCGRPLAGIFYTQGNNNEYMFRRCETCRLVNYEIAGGLDQGKYAREFPDPRDDASRRNIPQTATYNFLSRFLAGPGRLLEVGCGNGRLLYLARRGGWDVSGVELSPFLAESVQARLSIPVVVANIAEPGLAERLGAGSADVIVLRHVLEHVPAPRALMDLFRVLLSAGGHILFEFPNIDAIHFRVQRLLRAVGLHRKVFPPGYHPGHCNEYCRRSFAFLAEQSGFDVVAWETYSSNPLRNWMLNRWPVGTKARTLVRMR